MEMSKDSAYGQACHVPGCAVLRRTPAGPAVPTETAQVSHGQGGRYYSVSLNTLLCASAPAWPAWPATGSPHDVRAAPLAPCPCRPHTALQPKGPLGGQAAGLCVHHHRMGARSCMDPWSMGLC